MGDALSWAPWWLLLAVMALLVLVAWLLAGVAVAALWNLARRLVIRSSRRRMLRRYRGRRARRAYCRDLHPSVTGGRHRFP